MMSLIFPGVVAGGGKARDPGRNGPSGRLKLSWPWASEESAILSLNFLP